MANYNPNKKEKKIFSVSLEIEIYNKVNSIAIELGLSKSLLIQKVLENFVESDESKTINFKTKKD